MHSNNRSSADHAKPHALLEGVAPLTHLGALRVSGQDAAKFLHAQLTQDFVLLGTDKARLAALCTAKGRVLASFIGFKQSDSDIILLGSRDLIAVTAKRLSMYILRAKVALSDASDSLCIEGLAGAAASVPDPRLSQPWDVAQADGVACIQLYPGAGVARRLRVSQAGAPVAAGAPLDLSVWQWGEVQSGVATVGLAVQEAFIPQMLNYESVGGVNFKKGCYPGQEVVARSQFRGTLKRRTYLAHAQFVLAPGDEIMAANSTPDAGATSEPVGMVIQCAPDPRGGYACLVCLQTTAVASTGLHLAGHAENYLTLQELPYSLLQDI